MEVLTKSFNLLNEYVLKHEVLLLLIAFYFICFSISYGSQDKKSPFWLQQYNALKSTSKFLIPLYIGLYSVTYLGFFLCQRMIFMNKGIIAQLIDAVLNLNLLSATLILAFFAILTNFIIYKKKLIISLNITGFLIILMSMIDASFYKYVNEFPISTMISLGLGAFLLLFLNPEYVFPSNAENKEVS